MAAVNATPQTTGNVPKPSSTLKRPAEEDLAQQVRTRNRPPIRQTNSAYNAVRLGGRGEQGDAPANSDFPVYMNTADAEDDMYDIRRQYIEGTLKGPDGKPLDAPGVAANKPLGALGVPILDDKYTAYLSRKQAQAVDADFALFAANYFNMKDPATAAFVSKNILPTYSKDREAAIDAQAQLQATIAKINARGFPANLEEMRLIYHLQKGDIQLPTGAVFQPDTWSQAGTMQNIMRGMFNPKRWFLGDAGGPNGSVRFNAANLAQTGMQPSAGRSAPQRAPGATQNIMGDFSGVGRVFQTTAAAPAPAPLGGF